MDVFYIEFQKRGELTTDDPLVDGSSVPTGRIPTRESQKLKIKFRLRTKDIERVNKNKTAANF